jgi:hypothetical protein
MRHAISYLLNSFAVWIRSVPIAGRTAQILCGRFVGGREWAMSSIQNKIEADVHGQHDCNNDPTWNKVDEKADFIGSEPAPCKLGISISDRTGRHEQGTDVTNKLQCRRNLQHPDRLTPI